MKFHDSNKIERAHKLVLANLRRLQRCDPFICSTAKCIGRDGRLIYLLQGGQVVWTRNSSRSSIWVGEN